jgi:hypothetical protein
MFSLRCLRAVSITRVIRNIAKRSALTPSIGLVSVFTLVNIKFRRRTAKPWRASNLVYDEALVKLRSSLYSSARTKCLLTGRSHGLRFGQYRLRLLRNASRGYLVTAPQVRW